MHRFLLKWEPPPSRTRSTRTSERRSDRWRFGSSVPEDLDPTSWLYCRWDMDEANWNLQLFVSSARSSAGRSSGREVAVINWLASASLPSSHPHLCRVKTVGKVQSCPVRIRRVAESSRIRIRRSLSGSSASLSNL